MTGQECEEFHEAYIRRLNALDRQYAPDIPESPEEAEWFEKRMKEVFSMETNGTKPEI